MLHLLLKKESCQVIESIWLADEEQKMEENFRWIVFESFESPTSLCR